MRFFPATDLVLDNNNRVYHLGLHREHISEKIIIVGDQDRVGQVSSFFDHIEHQSQHREFVCHTGHYKGHRITALSTGIGTDNIDIVINELDALVNIDLNSRIELEQKTRLSIIRIGTCGILQPDIPVHSFILSSHAIGFDNVAYFYDIAFNESDISLKNQFLSHINIPNQIEPYAIHSSEKLHNLLISNNINSGITITSSGFYGPQGRSLRLKTHTENLHLPLGSFNWNGTKILNFEMESSTLFALGDALGHETCTICLGVANRPNFQFSKGYTEKMNELIAYTLEKIILADS
ncbi:MAG: nucleoside phosphorylase [Crocinitomicaceae bacterium]